MRASDNPSAARRPSWAAIALVTCLGSFFCLHDVGGKSLWGDEINIIHFVTGERDMALSSGNALGYFWLIEATMAIGKSDTMLRLPAVAFAILGLPVIMWIVSHLFDPRIGLGTGLLLAVAPTYVAHAQQVHVYSAFCLAAVVSLFCVWQVHHEGSRGWWLAWAVSIGIGMWLHLYTIFLVPAQVAILAALGLLDRRWRRPTLRELRSIALLALLPLLISLPLVVDWIAPLGLDLLNKIDGEVPENSQLKMPPSFQIEARTFLRAFRELTIWRSPFQTLHRVIATSALLGVVIGAWRYRAATLAGLLWILVPIPMITMFAYSSGIDFGTRRLIFALPVLLAFAAVGLDGIARLLYRPVPQRWRRALPEQALSLAVVGLLTVLTAASALHHYFVFQEHADRRNVARYLTLAQRPGDRLLVWRTNLLSYYYRGSLPLETIQGTAWLDANIVADPEVRRIWYVRPIFAGRYFEPLIPIEAWLEERQALHVDLGGGMWASMVDLDPEHPSDRRALAELAVALKPERPYTHGLLANTLADDPRLAHERRREVRRSRFAMYHPLVPWLQ